MTLTICVAWPLCWYVGPSPSDAVGKLVTECGKVLLTATFLLVTILNLSIAVPAQTALKPFITARPQNVLEYVNPFLWSLVSGIAGGIGLLFFERWRAPVHIVAIFFGVFGAFMQLNAIFYSIRVYVIGLLALGKSWESEQEKERRKTTESKVSSGTGTAATSSPHPI
jgi:hypothetical protein